MVTDTKRTNRPNEETVVAVRPDIARAAPLAVSDNARARRMAWLFAGGALLVIAIVVVFVALPRWVAQQTDSQVTVQSVGTPTGVEPSAPVLSPEELAALEAEAEALLAQLLPQQAELDQLSAANWGGADWLRYESLARQGDDAYLAKAFETAIDAYRDALETGRALRNRGAEIVAASLAAGDAAVDAGQSELAIEQYDIVLGIESGNAPAARGKARAERLPEVLELVRNGDDQRRAGQLDAAAQSYRAALALDSGWSPARAALAELTADMSTARFEAAMSRGLSALAGEDYDEAEEHFRAALMERPGAAEALDGMTEAQQGQQLDEIALAEARALAFERRELWDRAIAQYRAALQTDATLAFANEGLLRAQARADLDAKLVNLINNPTLLLRDDILRDASVLADEARALVEPETKLQEQVASLDRLIVLATTPIEVELSSDAQTQVTVYRVGELGAFTDRSIAVRPGTYTAVGSRTGYRDVRETFTVLPGREPPRIRVVCVETI